LWANPIPVSVALIPVRQGGRLGLLVVRRAIQPRQGFVALVGGFLEEHETWQQGAAREVREETGVEIDPASLLTFWFTSTEPRPNRVLLFSLGAEVDADSFSAFVPSHETSERGLVFGPEGLDSLFAFPLHAEAARRFFAKLGVQGPHEYTLV
jgi:ADP-ribose pyrophosphatase YjhB (NUDIX family)